MSDVQNALIPANKRPFAEIENKAGKIVRITRRVKAAVDAMVWEGLKRSDAAQSAGLKDHALYTALRKPHVRAYYLSECEVLRLSGRARRIHRLDELAEQDDNKQAAINAIRTLDQVNDDPAATSTASARAPGVVIVIQGAPSTAALTIHQRENGDKPL